MAHFYTDKNGKHRPITHKGQFFKESSMQIVKLGKEEAKEVDLDLPFKQRVLAEIEDYSRDYGIASLADITTEINTRGKELEFQGLLTVAATKNDAKVKKAIQQLIREGKVKRVKVPSAKEGYVVA